MSLIDKLKNDDVFRAAAGTTLCAPGAMPRIVLDAGFHLRSEKLSDGSNRNWFLGSVITNPVKDKYVFSDAYLDLKDGQFDETFFEYDLNIDKWRSIRG